MKFKGTFDYDLFYDPSYCYPVVTSHRDQKELRCSGISPGILCGHFSNVLTTMFRIISIHLYLLFISVRTIPFRNICKFGMHRWRHCMMAQAYGKRFHSAMTRAKLCISLQCLAWRIRNDKECIYPASFNGGCCVSDLEMTLLSFGYFVHDKSSILMPFIKVGAV